MLLQLKKIILWSRHLDVEPRTLDFELGSVNVITGASRTGKSAIIPIIDYCLGSDRCAIPVNTIRDSCEWFGLLVQTTTGERLFARREPGSQKSTGDMYVLDGKTISIPRTIKKNTTVEAVKQSLDELSGLTQLEFVPESTDGGTWGRPSFRDMVSFIFQPQNVIANPDVLFLRPRPLTTGRSSRKSSRTCLTQLLPRCSPSSMNFDCYGESWYGKSGSLLPFNRSRTAGLQRSTEK